MFDCKTCSRQFRDKYNLDKHMSRLKPCVPLKIKNNSSQKNASAPNPSFSGLETPPPAPNTSFSGIGGKSAPNPSFGGIQNNSDTQESSTDPLINKDNDVVICDYCLHTFSKKSVLPSDFR